LAAAAGLCACASTPAAPPTTAEEPAPVTAEENDLAAALMAGEFAWQDGRSASAARHFARAAELSDKPEVAAHATRVATVAKQWDLAEAGLTRWRTLAPEDAGIASAEVALALGQGRIDSAARGLVRLLGEGGENGRQATAQTLLGAPDRSAAADAMIRLADGPVLAGGAQTLVLLSQVARQLEADDVSARYADLAVERFPDVAQARVWRAHVRLRAGDSAGAGADLDRAAALEPADRTVALTRAAVLNEMGEPAKAAAALARIAPDDEVLAARAAYAARSEERALIATVAREIEALPEPRSEARLELLGQLAEIVEQRQQALDWYEAVPRGERFVPARLRIAVLHDAMGDTARALEELKTLRAGGIDDDAKLVDSFLLETELLQRHGRDADAIATYGRGLEALPDDRRLLYARALLFERLDRITECERDLRRIVELHPDDPDALNALGYTLADRTDRHAEARELIAQALALKPDEPAIVDSMGWVEYRLGNLEAALKHLRRAWELAPDAEIGAHLGEVLWVSGAKDEARKIWDAAKARDAENEALRETLERFDP
jgi:tetratricopeptide (TPR) repeat protein